MAKVFNASFGGVRVKSVDFHITQGISPGTGTVVFESSSALPKTRGVLYLNDGEGGKVLIEPVYIVDIRITESATGGKEKSATIQDRRLFWKHGWISGEYNKIKADGTQYQDADLKSLIIKCLEALNEVNYVIYDVPVNIYPEVNWEIENPAQMLHELTSNYGLSIGYTASNKIRISSALSVWFFSSSELSEKDTPYSINSKPASIKLFSGRKVLQRTFTGLIPVGEDTDGSIKAINDLSYAPVDWGIEIVQLFSNLGSEVAVELAKKCIFKWYMVDWTVYNKEECLPFLNVITDTLDKKGIIERDKPYLIGDKTIWDGKAFVAVTKAILNEGFSIDRKIGLVRFSTPVYKVQTSGPHAVKFTAPDLDLVAAYEQKENQDNDHLYWTKTISGGTGLPAIHKESALIPYYSDYLDANPVNIADLDAYAYKVLNNLIDLYQIILPRERKYETISFPGVYGILKSVSLQINPSSGGGTVISIGAESPPFDMPTYEERLQKSKVRTTLMGEKKEKVAVDRRNANDGGPAAKLDLPEVVDTNRMGTFSLGENSIGKNTTGTSMPAGSTAILGKYDTSTNAWVLTLPASDNEVRVVFLPNEIPAGEKGVIFFNHASVKYTGTKPVTGDRVATKASTGDIEKNSDGNMICNGDSVTGKVWIEKANNAGGGTRRAKTTAAWVSGQTVGANLMDSGGAESTEAITVNFFKPYDAFLFSKIADNEVIPVFKDVNGSWYCSYHFTLAKKLDEVLSDYGYDVTSHELRRDYFENVMVFDVDTPEVTAEMVYTAQILTTVYDVSATTTKLRQQKTTVIYALENGTIGGIVNISGTVCPG